MRTLIIFLSIVLLSLNCSDQPKDLTKKQLEQLLRAREKQDSTNSSGVGISQTSADGKYVTDPRDGKRYEIVRMKDEKLWFAQNLNFRDNGAIGFCYDGDEENCELYGALYLYKNAVNACPPGWHLPSNNEWWAMTKAYGGANIFWYFQNEDESKKTKEANSHLTNEKGGFKVLFGGEGTDFKKYQNYDDLNEDAVFHTSSITNHKKIYSYIFNNRKVYQNETIFEGGVDRELYYCRCVEGEKKLSTNTTNFLAQASNTGTHTDTHTEIPDRPSNQKPQTEITVIQKPKEKKALPGTTYDEVYNAYKTFDNIYCKQWCMDEDIFPVHEVVWVLNKKGSLFQNQNVEKILKYAEAVKRCDSEYSMDDNECVILKDLMIEYWARYSSDISKIKYERASRNIGF